MYLRYEPDSRNGDTQKDLYQAYGLGTWADTQIPQAQKLQASSWNGTSKPLAPGNTTKLEVAATQPKSLLEDSQARSSEGVSRTKQTRRQASAAGPNKEEATVSPLLAYRDPDTESSDEEDSFKKPSDQTVAEEDVDQDDDMDPTSAYVATKLKYTSLERRLGLANKSNKKGAKSKVKGSNPSVNSDNFREYEKLEARLKERMFPLHLLICLSFPAKCPLCLLCQLNGTTYSTNGRQKHSFLLSAQNWIRKS